MAFSLPARVMRNACQADVQELWTTWQREGRDAATLSSASGMPLKWALETVTGQAVVL